MVELGRWGSSGILAMRPAVGSGCGSPAAGGVYSSASMCTGRYGVYNVALVPFPGIDSMSNSPPIAAMRSVILNRPKRPGAVPG